VMRSFCSALNMDRCSPSRLLDSIRLPVAALLIVVPAFQAV